MNTKKVKRKKFNLLKFITFILFLYLVCFIVLNALSKPIKNIRVLNTFYLRDEEIIETAKLENYPSFYKTLSSTIEKRIKKLDLVSDVKVKKRFGYIIDINVTEHKIIYKNRTTNTYVLDDQTELELPYEINGVAVLTNYVTEQINKKLIKKMSTLNNNVLTKISEIVYSPTDYDEERFLLFMNDGNEVYITLNKIEEFSKYIKIKKQLGNKKGILYLDSGNYFEIKE